MSVTLLVRFVVLFFFFFNDTATTEIYTLSLHDALPIFSIDDFGTGYSSLSYLKRLPLHEVKIDRSFVAGVTHSRQDLAIVRSVIELGMNFGLDVVAEGVEDLATFELLQSLGVTRVQGWFVGRPMPQGQVAGWLEDRPVATTTARNAS